MRCVALVYPIGTVLLALAGCCHPSVTAVSLSPCADHCESSGIPFYLPKPILIVAKNFRNVEEAKVGLTDSAPIPNYLDDQAKYADLNARTSWTPVQTTTSGQSPAATSGNQQFPSGTTGTLATASTPQVFAGGAPISPGTVPSDGLSPDTFYTYQIVFVPDLTQKYGLKIKGGVGEIRAAMNLVNGWMFTGLGPYYMKDSSTAQNLLAGGIGANLTLGGAADVVNSLQSLKAAPAGGAPTGGSPNAPQITSGQIEDVNEKILHTGFRKESMITMGRYAEIHIFEPHLTPDGQMEWRPITELCFDREFLAAVQPKLTRTTKTNSAPATIPQSQQGNGSPTSGQPGLGSPPLGVSTSGTPSSGTPGNNQLVNLNYWQPAGTSAPPSSPPCKGPVERLCDLCSPHRPKVTTTLIDQELTPEQLGALLSKAPANQSLPPPVTPTPLPTSTPVQFTPATVGKLPGQ